MKHLPGDSHFLPPLPQRRKFFSIKIIMYRLKSVIKQVLDCIKTQKYRHNEKILCSSFSKFLQTSGTEITTFFEKGRYRRLRGDMIETFKILLGFYDRKTTHSLFSIVPTSTTRGHPYKLMKRQVSTTQFAQFFTNRVINAWNSLPEQVVKAGSIDTFKNHIDKHWAEFMYTTNFKI